MKKIIASALVASFAFAGAASAMGDSRVDAAQETLNTYGFNVDAGTLSKGEVNALAFLRVDSDIERHGRADARAVNKIRAILQ